MLSTVIIKYSRAKILCNHRNVFLKQEKENYSYHANNFINIHTQQGNAFQVYINHNDQTHCAGTLTTVVRPKFCGLSPEKHRN